MVVERIIFYNILSCPVLMFVGGQVSVNGSGFIASDRIWARSL